MRHPLEVAIAIWIIIVVIVLVIVFSVAMLTIPGAWNWTPLEVLR